MLTETEVKIYRQRVCDPIQDQEHVATIVVNLPEQLLPDVNELLDLVYRSTENRDSSWMNNECVRWFVDHAPLHAKRSNMMGDVYEVTSGEFAGAYRVDPIGFSKAKTKTGGYWKKHPDHSEIFAQMSEQSYGRTITGLWKSTDEYYKSEFKSEGE